MAAASTRQESEKAVNEHTWEVHTIAMLHFEARDVCLPHRMQRWLLDATARNNFRADVQPKVVVDAFPLRVGCAISSAARLRASPRNAGSDSLLPSVAC